MCAKAGPSPCPAGANRSRKSARWNGERNRRWRSGWTTSDARAASSRRRTRDNRSGPSRGGPERWRGFSPVAGNEMGLISITWHVRPWRGPATGTRPRQGRTCLSPTARHGRRTARPPVVMPGLVPGSSLSGTALARLSPDPGTRSPDRGPGQAGTRRCPGQAWTPEQVRGDKRGAGMVSPVGTESGHDGAARRSEKNCWRASPGSPPSAAGAASAGSPPTTTTARGRSTTGWQ